MNKIKVWCKISEFPLNQDFHFSYQPLNPRFNAFSRDSTAGTNAIVSVYFFQLQNFLHFFHRKWFFQVAFVRVKQVRNVRWDEFIFDHNFNFASGDVEPHFVGTVDNKDDATDFVFGGAVGGIGFPEVSVLGLTGHVNDFDVDLFSSDFIFFESDGGSDVGIEWVRIKEFGHDGGFAACVEADEKDFGLCAAHCLRVLVWKEI
jgi:hypothetical protein